jgi:N-acyl homoserine lactone hydrolase
MKNRRLWLVVLVLVVGTLGWEGWRLVHGNARCRDRVPYEVSAPSFRSWDEVLQRAPRVALHSLDTGAVHVAHAQMLGKDHPLAAQMPEQPHPLRVYAHLVRHPLRGDVLIDSGLDASFATDRYGNLPRPARWLIALLLDAPYTQDPGQDLLTQLDRLQARPHTVFFTHLHMDHTAGLPALPDTIRLVTGRSEADDSVQIFGFDHLPAGAPLHELDFRTAPDLPPLGPSLDLLGDGSLWAISTPGHSRGHVSFLVMSDPPTLLVGDASHFVWAFARGVGPAGTDERTAQESLDRLRAFAEQFPEVQVWTGHEGP